MAGSKGTGVEDEQMSIEEGALVRAKSGQFKRLSELLTPHDEMMEDCLKSTDSTKALLVWIQRIRHQVTEALRLLESAQAMIRGEGESE